jgi:hypothetical protein
MDGERRSSEGFYLGGRISGGTCDRIDALYLPWAPSANVFDPSMSCTSCQWLVRSVETAHGARVTTGDGCSVRGRPMRRSWVSVLSGRREQNKRCCIEATVARELRHRTAWCRKITGRAIRAHATRNLRQHLTACAIMRTYLGRSHVPMQPHNVSKSPGLLVRPLALHGS